MVLDVEGARAEADLKGARVRDLEDHGHGVPATDAEDAGHSRAARDATEACRGRRLCYCAGGQRIRDQAGCVHAYGWSVHPRERNLLFVDDVPWPDSEGRYGGLSIAQGEQHSVKDEGLDEGLERFMVNDCYQLVGHDYVGAVPLRRYRRERHVAEVACWTAQVDGHGRYAGARRSRLAYAGLEGDVKGAREGG